MTQRSAIRPLNDHPKPSPRDCDRDEDSEMGDDGNADRSYEPTDCGGQAAHKNEQKHWLKILLTHHGRN